MAPASVNLTSNSSACFPLYDAARLSPSFAKFCQAYIIVVAALLVLSNLALIKHRRKPYLAKRSPKLILLQSLYVPLALLVGPVAMLYPDKIKCDLFYWASMMIIPIASRFNEKGLSWSCLADTMIIQVCLLLSASLCGIIE